MSDPQTISQQPTVDASVQLVANQDIHYPLRKDFERIAQRMYTQNLALAQTNRTLSILRDIDILILEPGRDLQQLSTELCNAVIGSSPYAMVSILSLNRYNEHFINLQGHAFSTMLQQSGLADNNENLLAGLYMTLDGDWLSSKERNLVLDLDKLDKLKRVESLGLGAGLSDTLQTIRENYNVQSFYLTKLRARENLTGVMIIGLEETMPRIDDIELIERVSETVGIALDNRLLFEENQRFLKQLQNSNDHLKELDEAKDEFITMVSHQLRTPLTSMKGFVSMVLEGDTGPLSDPQRHMLQQAFDSSQRMVYLVADLLNASRLRSGKFVIINRPTNLPNVVESEINQLKEAATMRKVELNFVKPDNFPIIMLDETKIRQVVMNFIDNALYYTPSGGRIDVVLQVSDTTIEFTVSDTGMGVPSSEQEKLFSKFYRAGNARKLRPEGTGLGLYMAKKIIVAHGGAILFKSIENRGSTFGFIFPRQKVEATAEQIAAAPPTNILMPSQLGDK